MTCPHCHGIGQGDSCLYCLNATRRVVFLPPLEEMPKRDESDSHRLGLTLIAWLAGIAFLIFTVMVAVVMNPNKPY